MRLFRNYAYCNFIFPKINKRGVGIRAGGRLEIFSKINKWGGGRLFGTREHVFRHSRSSLTFSFIVEMLFEEKDKLMSSAYILTCECLIDSGRSFI